MDSSTVAVTTGLAAAGFALLFGAMIGVWAMIFARLHSGTSPVPFEARRIVPWKMPTVLLLMLCYFSAAATAVVALRSFLPAEFSSGTPISDEKEGQQHPAARLFQSGPLAAKLIDAFVVTVPVPICEEFLFRLVLQGWLESLAFRMRRRFRRLRRWMPLALAPVGLTALLFALLHLRHSQETFTWQFDFMMIVATGAAACVTVVVGVLFLRKGSDATLYDLGIVPGKLLSDVRLGALSFLAVILPIYVLQFTLSQVLPKGVAPDPMTLFFFALVLGGLYFRTHRIVPSIVLHMLLNATSIAMLLLMDA